MNPYDWQSHKPRIEIPRTEVEQIAETLGHGGSAVVLGGRGMGKSVFLRQVRTVLERGGETRIVLISAPPPDLTVRSCLDKLADALGVAAGALDSRKIVDAYFAQPDVPERLVLLFDEFDRYAARSALSSADPPGRGFFNDLEATRRDVSELGVLATGSLGVFVARDVLGSSFLARALHIRLTPFERSDLDLLARPFAERGSALSDAVLDALHLASGSIPALLTYGLQQLWVRERPPAEREVTAIYAGFRVAHGEYLRDLLRSVADPRLSEAPQRVLQRIRSGPGPMPRAVLKEACGPTQGPLDLDLVDVLHLLQAAGLVRLGGSIYNDDPVEVHAITGILNLDTASAPASRWREHLLRDLETLLEKLHRSSADFFRPGRDRPGDGKQLVPESVFAAQLGLGFELLGWRTEREAQSAAGRTDLKLRRNASREVAVIEVKIWGRNDFDQAQRQIESYWTTEVAAGAVVQITDAEIPDWHERYRHRCLDAPGLTVETQPMPESPIAAKLVCTSSTADGMTVMVDHYLLRLPRRS